MKIIGKFLKFIISVLLVAVIVVVGSFSTVFFISRENPQNIFIMNYALVAQKSEEGKISIWFIEKADESSIENGDGIVYYEDGYKSANAMLGFDGRVVYFDSASFDSIVSVSDDAVTGKIVALWQQK